MNSTIPKYYLYKRIVNAKIFIDNHFKEAFTIDQVAKISCFSKFHFIKLFKEVYEITPRQYIINKRFEEAKKLLRNSDSVLSIDNICYNIGYTSTNTFTVHFKNITGMSPSRWRNLHCNNPSDSSVPRCFLR